MKTAIVTGGTSGLGLAAAQTLAEKGLRVYALSRHGVPVPGVTSLACDITDADAVERTVAAIEAEAGRIDLVVNNAGFGISGAVECTTPEEARRLFDVDFFGVVNVNHAVLPRMRRAGGGRIVHVSSVAAPVAIPFQAYYSAAKAAINAYSSALRCEVAPFGIDVCAVMPGDLKTGFTAAREKNVRGASAAPSPAWSMTSRPVCRRRRPRPSCAAWRSAAGRSLCMPLDHSIARQSCWAGSCRAGSFHGSYRSCMLHKEG